MSDYPRTHVPSRPTVPQVAPLVAALYRRDFQGCCLHVALDDRNEEDSTLVSCIAFAEQRGHAECAHLGRLVLAMSRTQRKRLRWHRYDPA